MTGAGARRPPAGAASRRAGVARRAAGWLALGVASLLAGCGAPSPSAAAAAPTDGLTVFAATSLASPFTELGHRFEAAHPGARIAFSFGGSAGLVDQLAGGAPADVLATADEATMGRAAAARLVPGPATVFAAGSLVLIVPADNPGRVTGLDTLAGRTLVVCAPSVPCGAASLRLAQRAGVTLHPASEESNVGDVRGKVASGEADAGLVYRSEALLAGDRVRTIPLAHARDAANRYAIARVASSTSPLAEAFIALVSGPEGRAVLDRAGFEAP